MRIHKLSKSPAFIAFDLQREDTDVPAVGATRLARKILQDGAQLLARSTTYTFASFGIEMGGASAGINAEGDARADAVSAFVEEVGPLFDSGAWATDPDLGLTDEDFQGLRERDPRPTALWTEGLAAQSTAKGALAAVDAARPGGVDGAEMRVVGDAPAADALRTLLADQGADVGDADLSAPAEIVFVAGKAGVVDHEVAASMDCRYIVPLTPVPVTARAHAVLGRAGTVHVPDFLAVAGPLLVAYGSERGSDPVPLIAEAVTELVEPLGEDRTGLWLAACERAEAFLESWLGTVPFGRPLA